MPTTTSQTFKELKLDNLNNRLNCSVFAYITRAKLHPNGDPHLGIQYFGTKYIVLPNDGSPRFFAELVDVYVSKLNELPGSVTYFAEGVDCFTKREALLAEGYGFEDYVYCCYLKRVEGN